MNDIGGGILRMRTSYWTMPKLNDINERTKTKFERNKRFEQISPKWKMSRSKDGCFDFRRFFIFNFTFFLFVYWLFRALQCLCVCLYYCAVKLMECWEAMFQMWPICLIHDWVICSVLIYWMFFLLSFWCARPKGVWLVKHSILFTFHIFIYFSVNENRLINFFWWTSIGLCVWILRTLYLCGSITKDEREREFNLFYTFKLPHFFPWNVLITHTNRNTCTHTTPIDTSIFSHFFFSEHDGIYSMNKLVYDLFCWIFFFFCLLLLYYRCVWWIYFVISYSLFVCVCAHTIWFNF